MTVSWAFWILHLEQAKVRLDRDKGTLPPPSIPHLSILESPNEFQA
jgi:hypothetical protein